MKKRTLLRKSWLMGVAILSACSGAPVQLGPEVDVKYDSTRPRQISAEDGTKLAHRILEFYTTVMGGL